MVVQCRCLYFLFQSASASRDLHVLTQSFPTRRVSYLRAVNENVAGAPARAQTAWHERFDIAPATWRNISKPINWQDYRFPFIYGQVDPELFPIAVWRACSRDALGRSAVNYWAAEIGRAHV